MGLRFMLNLKFGSPFNSHFITNSSYYLPSLSRGRESANVSAKLSSFGSSLYRENIHSDLMRAHRCSSTSLLEHDWSVMERIQMNIGKTSLNGGLNLYESQHSSPKKNPNPSSFGLLMESIDKLETMSTDSDVEVLKRDILQQLERLGALQLFHICLSKTLKDSTLFDLSDNQTQIIEPQSNCSVLVRKRIVRSTKKEERRIERDRRSDKSPRQVLPAKSNEEGWEFSSIKRKVNSKNGRLRMAKNEVEMSKGVKMISDLENTRMVLEQETGRVATFTSWAEAVGVDVKILQKQLHFGWYCRDELLRSTRSLVFFIARNYRGPGIAFEDIIQAGNVGVLQGAIRFDHTRGYKFSTYVQYWIRKSISMFLTQHSRGVRIPFTLSKTINQIHMARKTLNGSLGKYLSDDEIAKFTGLTVAKINTAGKCLRVVGSLDQKMGDSLGAKILEFTPDKSIKSPEETVMRQHMIKEIHNILKTLEPTERQVLVLRFGLGDHQRKSLEETGRLFRVSKEWIRRVERKALMKLRNEDFCTNLSHYIHL